MNPLTIEIIGAVAAVLTTSASLPQALKCIKTKNTSGLSLTSYLMMEIGVIFWLVYGISLSKLVLILPQLIVMPVLGTIIYYIINNKIKEKKLKGDNHEN
jgi:MtN3 and saliva related transmembrane protein